MHLVEFVALQEVEEAEGDLNQEVTGLAYDSRKVSAGQIFFAISGEKVDGHDFILDAVGRGAVCIVLERNGACPQGTAWVRVRRICAAPWQSGAHISLPTTIILSLWYTGTNGKTTVTYLVESMLAAAGSSPGVIGTINYRYEGREVPSHHTTPESLDLQVLLSEMLQANVKSVVMEVSSHALAQERVRGLEFDIALFTNLSRDHLDYHRDMNDYFSAKSRLFTDHLKNSRKKKKAAVIHGGDPWGKELLKEVHGLDLEVWSYGRENGWDVHPVELQSDVAGVRGRVQVKHKRFEFSSPLVGAANLENVLGAVGVGFALGLPAEAVFRGIEQLKSVPGRLEKVDNGLGISIFVDYAHTPDALKKYFSPCDR